MWKAVSSRRSVRLTLLLAGLLAGALSAAEPDRRAELEAELQALLGLSSAELPASVQALHRTRRRQILGELFRLRREAAPTKMAVAPPPAPAPPAEAPRLEQLVNRFEAALAGLTQPAPSLPALVPAPVGDLETGLAADVTASEVAASLPADFPGFTTRYLFEDAGASVCGAVIDP